jgi:hypothetical protein
MDVGLQALSIRHPLNLRHIIVKNDLLAAIVPFDGHSCPIFFNDRALIVFVGVPANTVADGEGSRLVSGHWAYFPSLFNFETLSFATTTVAR